MTNKKLVFVYGTLKSGGYNNSILGNSKSLGPAVTIEDTFTMFNGGFPYVIPEGKFHVRGELFEVDNEMVLTNLDRLEGVPHHFVRREVDVRTNEGERVTGFMYVAAPGNIDHLKKWKHADTVLPDEDNICEWK